MKFGSIETGRFRKPERLLLLLLLCVFWTLRVYAAPLKFVQVTDLHLYDKDDGPANQTALIDFIQKVNELTTSGEVYDFVVVTGDIGIEGLIKDIYKKPPDLRDKEEKLKKNGSLTAQQLKELDDIRLDLIRNPIEIDNKIIAAAREVAAILDRSKVSRWLFLPGNNDLIDEEIETGKFYSRFIEQLGVLLTNKKEIRDLTDPKLGPYIKDSHVFIGFNNASFKNNDDPRRITDEKPEKITVEAIKHRVSTTEAPKLSAVGQKQKQYIVQVSSVVDLHPSSNVYILYHIPEIDDSHPVLNFNSHAASQRLLSMNEPYAISAWFVEGEVRRLWHDLVNKSQVKALLAGHFHDWRHTTYDEGFDWMYSPKGLYAGNSKLHVCAPLAIKRQVDTPYQARGFQVVSVDDAGTTKPERWWYYSNTHTFTTTAPGATVQTEGNAMKIFEQIVLLIGHLAWPLVAIGALILLRKQLRDVFLSIGNRIADPSTDVAVADWITLKKNVAANTGKLESLALGIEVGSAAGPRATQATSPESIQQDMATLRQMADNYLNIKIQDGAVRVRRKNNLATEMGNFIIQRQLPRREIAEQNHEGLTVALASAINALPLEGDLELLLKASEKVSKLHVKYRIVVAIGRLFEAGLATAADAVVVKKVLEAFKQKADDPLRRRIDQTESIIDLAMNKPKAE